MVDYLKLFSKKFDTHFRRVKGSRDELYSDGLLFLRFDDEISIKTLMINIPISCEAAGEDYDLIESGYVGEGDVYYMVYT